MNENDWNYYSIFEKNNNIKVNEEKTINMFSSLYNIVRHYGEFDFSYDEMIGSQELRIDFLVKSVDIALTNKNMDQNTINIILQMYQNIYNYLFGTSQLEEIEIPREIKEGISNENIIPNYSQISFIMTLLRENKRIFNAEFESKDFSQTIKQGFHSNITEVLRIEKKDLSHLLGLTNEGSLYEFYRKTIINKKIIEILNSLNINKKSDISSNIFNKFNEKFKEIFGLDYNKENYIKLINWRYNMEEDKIIKKGLTITQEDKIILNRTCDLMPKSKTIDFYCSKNIEKLFIQENTMISDYVYAYLKNKIIEYSKIKGNYNELKKIFNNDELEAILNPQVNANKKKIRKMIDKYVNVKKYKLEEDKIFKMEFLSKFGYAYPLINYNEVLSKNVSFYNFSLFKNLNSIIVDYDSKGKKYNSDVFLVSFAKDKMKSIKNKLNELISKKDEEYNQASLGNNYNKNYSDREVKYIESIKSLLCFPIEDRYYMRYDMSEDKNIQKGDLDDTIVEKSTEKSANITLFGFQTKSEEKERISNFSGEEMCYFDHYHTCETNLTANYYEYMTDFVRRGVEYPIDYLVQESKVNGKKLTKVLKINQPQENLDYYLKLFNEYKYRYSNENNLIYENYLIDKIINITSSIEKIEQANINVMKYNVKKSDNYEKNNNLEIEMNKYNEMNIYYKKLKDYLLEYRNYINKKDINIDNIDTNKKIR